MYRRLHELDSLTGLAALSVLIGHCLAVTTFFSLTAHHRVDELLKTVLTKSPLAIVFEGEQAVIYFFILSGFVLALPYIEGHKLPYGSFVVRRVWRIYVPYMVALATAIALRFRQALTGYSTWFNTSQWHDKVTFSNIMNHILFIGNYNSNTLVPVIWSTIQEMHIFTCFSASGCTI